MFGQNDPRGRTAANTINLKWQDASQILLKHARESGQLPKAPAGVTFVDYELCFNSDPATGDLSISIMGMTQKDVDLRNTLGGLLDLFSSIFEPETGHYHHTGRMGGISI